MAFFSKHSSRGHKVNGEYLHLQAVVKSTKEIKAVTKADKTMPILKPRTKWYEGGNN